MNQSPPVSVRAQSGVAVITIDAPPVNALSDAVRRGLVDAFMQADRDDAVTAIVLTGAGDSFVAGADLREMALPPQSPSLPDVMLAMEACAKPIVAAINGAALGGGLELALACDLRIAGPRAALGLPETKLGMVPGSGGTQRLPRLVGSAKAIEMIGQAKIVKAQEALALGVVDQVAEDPLTVAIAAATTTRKRRVSRMVVQAADAEQITKAADGAIRRARGNTAVASAIELVRDAARLPFDEAVAKERAEFLRLRESEESKALRHLFFAEREAGKGASDAKPRDIRSVAVIGGGLMGAGIASCFADAGFPVSLIERDADAAAAAGERIAGIYDAQLRSGRLDDAGAREKRERVTASDDWTRVADAQLVVEAVFEDMALKQEVFRRIDTLAAPGTILATNTSYLDIDAIAAVTGRPQDVIGLHFFSPANVMRLLEVVRADKTAPDALATAFRIGRRIGKLPIIAGVCDGFIGNRIFSLFRREAEYLVEEGATPERIDRALERYGLAMGPFAVADLAGLNIAWATRKRREAANPGSERPLPISDKLCELGRFGRKAGRGWYLYRDGAPKPSVDPEVGDIVAAVRAAKGIAARTFTDAEIVQRMLGVMASEGKKVLAEGIAQRASDIDLVFVNGYGFPAVKGGPMYGAARGFP